MTENHHIRSYKPSIDQLEHATDPSHPAGSASSSHATSPPTSQTCASSEHAVAPAGAHVGQQQHITPASSQTRSHTFLHHPSGAPRSADEALLVALLSPSFSLAFTLTIEHFCFHIFIKLYTHISILLLLMIFYDFCYFAFFFHYSQMSTHVIRFF